LGGVRVLGACLLAFGLVIPALLLGAGSLDFLRFSIFFFFSL